MAEFAGKHNIRNCDTIEQMASVFMGLVGKRLMYKDLIAKPDNTRSEDDIEAEAARVYGAR